jgi:hypothetical protein
MVSLLALLVGCGQVSLVRPVTRPCIVAAQTATPGTVIIGGNPTDPASDTDLNGRPNVTAARTNTPPVIDGNLDDALWKTAAHITSFTQQRPVEGAPATEQTEVSIAYDSRNLYFGIYARYSDPRQIRANRANRDKAVRDDIVSIFFDPFLDHQRAYVFAVNAYGVQSDAMMGSSPQAGGGGGGGGQGGGGGGGQRGGGGQQNDGQDPSWDALFYSAGRLVADGWVPEMSIPFKSLRYPGKGRDEVHRWGFQIQRDIESKNESVVWAPVSRDIMGFIRQMGVLQGMTDLSTRRNFEIMPTFTAIKSGTLDTSSRTFRNADVSPEAGVNVKYGITSNLTADFTLNPDFSQISADIFPTTAYTRTNRAFFTKLQYLFRY